MVNHSMRFITTDGSAIFGLQRHGIRLNSTLILSGTVYENVMGDMMGCYI